MNILGFVTGLSSVVVGDATNLKGVTTNISDTALEGVEIPAYDNGSDFVLEIEPCYFPCISVYRKENDGYWNDRQLIACYDEDNTAWFVLGVETATDTYQAKFWTGSGWVIAPLGTMPTDLQNAINRLDVHFKANGVFVYLNGILQASLNSNLTRPTKPITKLSATSTGGWVSQVSSMFVTDEDARHVQMVQHSITGDGDYHSEMVGSYAAINGLATLGTTGGITASYTNAHRTFKHSSMPSEFNSGYDILAVGVVARASSAGVGGVNSMSILASDGSTTVESVDTPLDAVNRPKKAILTNAPDGGLWNVAKFDAAEFGIRTKSGVEGAPKTPDNPV